MQKHDMKLGLLLHWTDWEHPLLGIIQKKLRLDKDKKKKKKKKKMVRYMSTTKLFYKRSITD